MATEICFPFRALTVWLEPGWDFANWHLGNWFSRLRCQSVEGELVLLLGCRLAELQRSYRRAGPRLFVWL